MDRWPTRPLACSVLLVVPATVIACGSVSAQLDADPPRDAPVADIPPVQYCDPADPALVGCYELEPASPPTKLVDSSSAGNNGTVSGVTYVTGHDGSALRFTPTTSRVLIPNSPSLDVTSVTLELWLRTDTVIASAATATLFNNNHQYGAVLLSGNVLQCQFILPSATSFLIESPLAIDVGPWTHIACTYDATGIGRAFINGAVMATETTDPEDLSTTDPAGSVIGADSPCAQIPCTDAFNGDIDGLRIWNRVRTPAEICADSGRTGC